MKQSPGLLLCREFADNLKECLDYLGVKVLCLWAQTRNPFLRG